MGQIVCILYPADCTNTCQNGGVVTKGSSGCSCKCPSGLKGSDCSQLDTSDGMFKVHRVGLESLFIRSF